MPHTPHNEPAALLDPVQVFDGPLTYLILGGVEYVNDRITMVRNDRLRWRPNLPTLLEQALTDAQIDYVTRVLRADLLPHASQHRFHLKTVEALRSIGAGIAPLDGPYFEHAIVLGNERIGIAMPVRVAEPGAPITVAPR